MGKALKYLSRGSVWLAEKTVSELALLGVIFSATDRGGYTSRILEGLTGPFSALYQFGKAYFINQGVRDFVNKTGSSILTSTGNLLANLGDDLDKTLISGIAIFSIYKGVPFVSSRMRKSLKEKKRNIEGRV